MSGSADATGSAFQQVPTPVVLEWVDEIGSTQVELVTRARAGALPQALATTSQTAGHGRRGRDWSCPPGAGIAMSVLTRPRRADAWTWLPLLAGLAVIDAVQLLGADDLSLKWPNDVLAPSGKLAGIVAERVESPLSYPGLPPAFVLGVGINLTSVAQAPNATSLRDLGLRGEARALGDGLLASLVDWVERWDDDPVSVAAPYRARCATLGQDVQVSLPGGHDTLGRAVAVDDDGCLVVDSSAGRRVFSAGDVVHLRAR